MTKKPGPKKPEVVCDGSTPVTRITPQKLKKLHKLMKKRLAMRRKKYPEVHGKVVDYITHSIDDGTLYFAVWFKDKTGFSLRYACDMFVVSADFTDWNTGNEKIIRRYMKPIPK